MMTSRFADTFFFVALLSETDSAHERALTLSNDLHSRLVTTEWVLTEVGDAMAHPMDRPKFLALLDLLKRHPLVTIVAADHDSFKEGVALFSDRPDKRWSLTDCISFCVMRARGLIEALTADRHFEQAGFTALLKE
ncbi:MAG: PIN domain-containing protein [Candidatus Sumerlaeota bacterium]|nr:PIN domain-containing protein [Candidatus Sumerlaeota bacterium]